MAEHGDQGILDARKLQEREDQFVRANQRNVCDVHVFGADGSPQRAETYAGELIDLLSTPPASDEYRRE